MSLNETASGERVHISFFGLRNAGKSSLVNAVTGQSLAVVSDVKGTTTDPVRKAMELLPIGAVVIIDTPGIDDEGELGELRVNKAKGVLAKTDVAVLVVDSVKGLQSQDSLLISEFKKRNIPYIIAFNKCELLSEEKALKENEIYVSALKGVNIQELKELIGKITAGLGEKRCIVSDLLEKGSVVVLVVPIDESAPKGRLILPQQMTIRDVIESGNTALVCKDTELERTLDSLKDKPDLVITDSQVFSKVAKILPDDVPLTSFSILMARYKGELDTLVEGAECLRKIKGGASILISEGCTHHRQCNDIGTVKLPQWIRDYTKADVRLTFTSGGDFPENLKEFDLIVHCGGCMLNEREMKHRIALSREQGVPMVNYGVAIALMHGILDRSLEIFK